MIYFSEFKGKKVVTDDQVEVGKIEDLIFLVSENAWITKLVVRSPQKIKLLIAIEFVNKINKQILLKKDYVSCELEENELYLIKNLLDKQIIDLKGNKIVRVNDVAIQEKNGLYIAGVDIGVLGILRWLKIEKLINGCLSFFNLHLRSQFLSWSDVQPLELAGGKVKLKKVENKLQQIRPEDLANYLERTNIDNVQKFIKILDRKKAAEVIRSFNASYQIAVIRSLNPEKAAEFISYIDPDDAVDVLLNLSQRRRNLILEALTPSKRQELEHLLQFSDDPVGQLMTSEFITVGSEETVKNTINKIKNSTSGFSLVVAVYGVNSENQLVGVFDLHELILQDLDTLVYKFMKQDVIVGHMKTPVETIYKKMIKYRISTVPIINDKKHIIGIVTISDVANYVFNKK